MKKSLCDAIGGTLKQLVASHSLKGTSERHILTPLELYDWAKNKIAVIRFICLEKEAVDLKPGQDIRFQGVKTASGAPSYHVPKGGGGGTLSMCPRVGEHCQCAQGWGNTVNVPKGGGTLSMCSRVGEHCQCAQGNTVNVPKGGGTLLMCPRVGGHCQCAQGWGNTVKVPKGGGTLSMCPRVGDTVNVPKGGGTLLMGNIT